MPYTCWFVKHHLQGEDNWGCRDADFVTKKPSCALYGNLRGPFPFISVHSAIFLSDVFKKQPCTHFGKPGDVLFINLSHLEVVSNHEEPDKRASRAGRQPSSRVPVHVGVHTAPPGRCVCVLLLQQRCCADTLTLHRH